MEWRKLHVALDIYIFNMNLSLITATYNCESFISSSLNSVLSQEFLPFEHVIIDGASSDQTLVILRDYLNSQIKLISEPDNGLYEGLNKGISFTNGDVLGILHSDDFYADHKVLLHVYEAFKNPKVQAVYGDLVYVDRLHPQTVVRHWISGKFVPSNLARGWMPPHPTLFLRRSLYQKFGSFDTRYKISADYDFILRIFSQLTPEQVAYIPEVLVKMRTGGVSNRSFKHLMQKSWEDYQIIRKHQIGGFGTLLRKNLSKVPQFFSK